MSCIFPYTHTVYAHTHTVYTHTHTYVCTHMHTPHIWVPLVRHWTQPSWRFMAYRTCWGVSESETEATPIERTLSL